MRSALRSAKPGIRSFWLRLIPTNRRHARPASCQAPTCEPRLIFNAGPGLETKLIRQHITPSQRFGVPIACKRLGDFTADGALGVYVEHDVVMLTTDCGAANGEWAETCRTCARDRFEGLGFAFG